DELRIILEEAQPLPAIHRMAELDLLRFLNPNLKLDQRLQIILEETASSIDWHRLLYLDEACQYWRVYLLALLSRISDKEAASFCKLFELPERIENQIMQEKAQARKAENWFNRRRTVAPSEIFLLLNELSQEGLLHLMSITKRTGLKKAISHYVTQLRHVTIKTTGNNLKKMGYKEGPLYKKILDQLLAAKLDDKIKTASDEIAYVQRHFPISNQIEAAE
ncbi:MAG: prohead protease, partial [Desulfobulbaceae bacterium]|nr:prohead protease [Desulfobulbaceae bacterium]